MIEILQTATGVFLALVIRALAMGAIETWRMRTRAGKAIWKTWLDQSRMNG